MSEPVKPRAQQEVSEGLERQVERASLFTHTALSRSGLRMREIESFLYGLLDVLLRNGLVNGDDVAAAAAKVESEQRDRGEIPEPGVAVRVDADPGPEPAAPVLVDCAARMHVCHAVCCSLDFALSEEEIEAGNVKWDLGRPYFIRHETSGFCTHSDRSTGRCLVYENRPRVCSGYSCANDTRIWKDFEAMELNEEWLSQHRGASRPVLVAATLAVPKPHGAAVAGEGNESG